MRIALISQEYPPETGSGGIGTQAFQKANWLAEHGHEVHVISHSRDGRRHEYQAGGVHVIRIPGFDEKFAIAADEVRWLTYSMCVAVELAHLHAMVDLELAEFPEWGCEAYIHLLNRTPENRFPTVIHLHGPVVMFAHALNWPDPNSEFFRVARIMEETCLRLADAVFSSSRCSAEWCARHHKLDFESVPILHTGVDTSLFRVVTVAKYERPTIAFVGRIERNKGVDLLIEAACKLAAKYPGLQVQLIGRANPNVMAELQSKAIAAGYPSLIQLPGFVAREQLPLHLSRSHVFAAPSQYEGGPGFVYLEAMACGLPVIACAGSGASEVIKDGVTGVLVPPHNVTSLTQAIDRLLASESVRAEMGARARDYVEREANSELCLQQIESFYSQVIQKCRRSLAHV